uniref:Solute carrier family 35 member F6 n=1 Tax=Cyanoderma ruficeps TaxID=181631 RepID=A0A8C3RFG6_9PASS
MTSASSFQMLRGSLIIFTGLLSVAFLGRKLEWSHWLGILLTILGLALVGLADLRGSGGAGHGLADVITGIPGMLGGWEKSVGWQGRSLGWWGRSLGWRDHSLGWWDHSLEWRDHSLGWWDHSTKLPWTMGRRWGSASSSSSSPASMFSWSPFPLFLSSLSPLFLLPIPGLFTLPCFLCPFLHLLPPCPGFLPFPFFLYFPFSSPHSLSSFPHFFLTFSTLFSPLSLFSLFSLLFSPVFPGDLLILLAQGIVSIQMVLEEKFIFSHDVHPLRAVGTEGFFGFAILALLLVPLSFIPAGRLSGNPRGVLEDPADAFCQIRRRPLILAALLGNVGSISFFNFAGISVTRELSATTRTVLDSLRTLLVWALSLALRWERFHALQIPGFALLLAGAALYNGLHRALLPRRPAGNTGNSGNGDQEEREALLGGDGADADRG